MYDPTMRVLAVLELLQARERVTTAELAAALEVSARTVRRYVTRLQDLGVPVESMRGPTGAYRLRAGFKLPPLMFTDDEALALALGLGATRHLGLAALTPATHAAAAKVSRVLPAALRERWRDVEETLVLDFAPMLAPADVPIVTAFVGAARARRRLLLTYADRAGGETRRAFAPYAVVRHGGRWFTVGHCALRGAERSLRLDRVRGVFPTDEPFERPPDFDAAVFLHRSLALTPAGFAVDVRLHLPPDEARRRVPPTLAVLEAEGGATRLRCGVAHLEWIASVLLGLGCDFDVLAPAELRGALSRVARRAARAAGDPG